jgi:hypothetical protein
LEDFAEELRPHVNSIATQLLVTFRTVTFEGSIGLVNLLQAVACSAKGMTPRFCPGVTFRYQGIAA